MVAESALFLRSNLALNLPLFRIAVAAALPLLAGCNAGAIALGYVANHDLTPQTVSGTLSNAGSTTKVGYIAWIELMQDGTVSGRLNFDLVQDKNVTFDKIATPSGNSFSLQVSPKSGVAEGTYVVFAWNDTNGNNIYEGDQGETRAQEVYRVRGEAATRNLWTTEKFIFTDQKLSIDYADVNSLAFTF